MMLSLGTTTFLAYLKVRHPTGSGKQNRLAQRIQRNSRISERQECGWSRKSRQLPESEFRAARTIQKTAEPLGTRIQRNCRISERLECGWPRKFWRLPKSEFRAARTIQKNSRTGWRNEFRETVENLNDKSAAGSGSPGYRNSRLRSTYIQKNSRTGWRNGFRETVESLND